MPRIVAPNAPRRLPALPAVYPSPPQTSPDVPAPVFRPDGLGGDFGCYGGLGGARHLWTNQTPFPGHDVTSVNKFAQDQGFHGLQLLDNVDATNWGQHGPTDYSAFIRDTLNVLDDSGCLRQYDGSVGYDAYASSTSPYTASSQVRW